jgi:hypothetical protein
MKYTAGAAGLTAAAAGGKVTFAKNSCSFS